MTFWTDEKVSELLKLWETGLSAAQIAPKLGCASRSAVLGKIHRLKNSNAKNLGLNRPARRVRTPRAERPKRVYKVHKKSGRKSHKNNPRTKALKTIKAVEIPAKWKLDGTHISILELSPKMCRWPYGNPGEAEFHYCAHVTYRESSYCAHHHEKSVSQPRNRRKKPTEDFLRIVYA